MAMIGRRPQGSGPSFMQMLDGVLGGYTVGTVKDRWAEEQARIQAAEARQKFIDDARNRAMPQAYQGMAGPTMDGSEPQAQAIPQGQRRSQLPTLADMGPSALDAMGRGAKLDDVTGYLKNAQEFDKAEYVNGFRVKPNSPDAPRFIPTLERGQEPLFDSKGNIAYIRNIDGVVKSVAELEGAKTRAQEAGKSEYDLVEVPQPDGSTMKMRRSDALGQTFRGQAPSDASAAKVTADAQAQAGVDLPSALETSTFTRNLIQQLRDHPGRKFATGATGVFPGVPGTPQQDFITMLDQAKGTTFLQAFEKLKGGGQITEVEGKKAEQAIARLNRTQSEEGFLKSLADLESVVSAADMRAKQKAGQGGGVSSRGLSTSMFPRNAVEAEMRRRGLLQ